MTRVKYQISSKKYIWIDTLNYEEIEIIQYLNNEFDKEKKKTKAYRKNTISLNLIEEKYNFEFADFENSLAENLEEKFQKQEIYKAINALPKRERQVIIDYFYKDKSLRQIARENHLSITTIRESYHAAIKRLRKKLKKFVE